MIQDAVFFVILIISIYTTVTLLHYFLSGWNRLRKRYKTGKIKLIKSWPFEMVQFSNSFNLGGLARGNGCFIFGYSPEGVYAEGFFLIAPFHRPILIPWNDVVLTVIDGYCITSTEVPEIGIMISKKVYDGLMDSKRIVHVEGLGELAL